MFKKVVVSFGMIVSLAGFVLAGTNRYTGPIKQLGAAASAAYDGYKATSPVAVSGSTSAWTMHGSAGVLVGVRFGLGGAVTDYVDCTDFKLSNSTGAHFAVEPLTPAKGSVRIFNRSTTVSGQQFVVGLTTGTSNGDLVQQFMPFRYDAGLTCSSSYAGYSFITFMYSD